MRIFLPTVSHMHMSRIELALRQTKIGRLSIDVAYSVKTNPDPRIVAAAHEHGLIVEAISQFEVEQALKAGFSAREVVLNGPGKWWPSRVACDNLRVIFCDSASELDQTVEWMLVDDNLAEAIGVRVRPTHQRSRFGVPLYEPGIFDDVATSFSRLGAATEIGLHFHFSPYIAGFDGWWRLLAQMIDLAKALERATSRRIGLLDLGGGWKPADFIDYFLPALSTVLAPQVASLAGLTHVLLEPGRAVAEPLVALLTTALDVRRGRGYCDIVVDTSIADVPEISMHEHQWLLCSNGRFPELLGRGRGTILGRSCIEADVLATGIEIPKNVCTGDLFVITNVGAYDTSKSYSFGRGEGRGLPSLPEI
jgi:diaminopimelate decarboxylase